MASSVYKLFSGFNVAVGATYNFEWKNVPGRGQAVTVSAYATGAPSEEGTGQMDVEVTRFVRRRRFKVIPGGIGAGTTTEVHDDIYGAVKNVSGSHAINFDLFLVVFS